MFRGGYPRLYDAVRNPRGFFPDYVQTYLERDVRSPMTLDWQRITLELLAERANLSVPTVRRLLNEGAGTFENFLRVARILGLLQGVEDATDPLNTPIGRARAEQDVPKRVRR